jgi:hypothetical protein
MKTSLYLTTFLLLGCITGIYAQTADHKSCYGSDPLLYNGIMYRYYVPSSTTGTQFYSGQEFSEGSAKIRGVTFSRLNLNYDVYNQQLVMKYNTPAGGIDQVVISDAWLEAFNINGLSFEVNKLTDSTAKIFRVVGADSLKVLYHYTKDLVLGSGVSAMNMRFTSPVRYSYLYNGKRLVQYAGNRNFIRIFPKTAQTELRRFIRKSNINV